tara:strand:- start:8790 stop:10838 length:2049 start_codon:yes stop_codon:yes gene_type:complete
MYIRQVGCFLILILTLSAVSFSSIADKKIRLATSEREPYIGESLPNNGYLHELVTEAFKQVGYTVNIDFYPLARARLMAVNGNVAGLLPSYYDPDTSAFVYSEPFPGNSIGLLKKKDLKIPDSLANSTSLPEALRNLSEYRIGIVRGDKVSPEFDRVSNLNKLVSTNDLQNIKILAANRVDFVAIDKFTAADLITNYEPQFIGKFDFLASSFTSLPFHVAFSKKQDDYQQLVKDFNRGLNLLIQEGRVEAILARHGLLSRPVKEKGKTALTIGTVNNNDMIRMKALSKEFEKLHTDIKLQWRITDENTLRKRLLSDLAISDGQFDILTIGTYETPIWAEKDWLVALDNLPKSYQKNDLFASVTKALSHQDKLYALPFYAESTMTYYRKDLFEKAGLTIPDKPNYEDIERFAAALHQPEQETYGICLRGKPGWGENMALLGIMVNAFGGRWFDENWLPTIDTPHWQKAVDTYTRLLLNYGPPQAYMNGYNENLKLFSEGHCAMWIDATVAAGQLFNPDLSKVHDRLGFSLAPSGTTATGSHWLWSWALAIPQSSKNQEQAQQFIAWATSKEYIQLVADNYGWVSAPPGTRQSTYANKQYQQAAPFANFVKQAIQTADPVASTVDPKPYLGIQYVNIPEFPAIATQIGNKIADILKGNAKTKSVLKSSQALTLQQMQRSNYIQQ